jgi:hypothetical protein
MTGETVEANERNHNQLYLEAKLQREDVVVVENIR